MAIRIIVLLLVLATSCPGQRFGLRNPAFIANLHPATGGGGGGGITIQTPLDSVANLTNMGAWSASGRLITSYSGNIMEVRRSSDGSITNIGQNSSGFLDTNTLLSWTGAGQAFVRTLYDQVSTNHMTNYINDNSQPLIVSNAVLYMSGVYPVMNFNAGQSNNVRVLNWPGASSPFPITLVAYAQWWAGTAGNEAIPLAVADVGNASQYFAIGSLTGKHDSTQRAGTAQHATGSSTITNNTRLMLVGVFTNTTSFATYSDTNIFQANNLTGAAPTFPNHMRIGGYADSTPDQWMSGQGDSFIVLQGVATAANMTNLWSRK